MELTDRKKRVLRAIVETYINTAEPVGSKAIAQLRRCPAGSVLPPSATSWRT